MKFLSKKMVLLCLAVLLPLCAEGAEQNAINSRQQIAGQPSRESVLGDLKLGDPEPVVKKKLPGLKNGDQPEVSVADNWSVWISTDTRTLQGVSYEERAGVRQGVSYPKTGGGVSINSTLKDVDAIYGKPERSFAGKSSFVLRNSELAYIFAYPSKGLWIVLTNQRPYSGSPDWRVTSITVGSSEMIDRLLAGVYAYATTPLTPKTQGRITAQYKKKYGSEKDLEIHDAYQYNLQSAYFELVRSRGPYVVTPGMIIPQGEQQAKELLAELAPATPLLKELDSRAKQKTMAAYGVSDRELDRISGNVQTFRAFLFKKDLEARKPEAIQSLHLPQGQCK